MFANQTSIGKLVARGSARTEAVLTRLRLSHMLQNADFTPPGFPPQAILIVRHAAGPRPVSLAALRLSSKWEREVRENITRLYRAAERPVRGIVRAGAQAVLFADVGEWLACLGVAARAGGVEQTWYWRLSLRKEAVASSLTLARVWAKTPRFVPAAIAHLAHWGRVAEVLQLFSPRESNEVFAALAGEWSLPNGATDPAGAGFNELVFKNERRAEQSSTTSVSPPDNSYRPTQPAEGTRKKQGEANSSAGRINHERRDTSPAEPPWNRWTPALEKSCEQLPVETQRLLAGAIALFHAPARGRSASFAAEVSRWLLATSERRERTTEQFKPITPEGGRSSDAVRTFKAGPIRKDLSPSDSPIGSAARVPPVVVPELARVEPSEKGSVAEKTLATSQSGEAVKPAGAIEVETARFWRDLAGSPTKIGGVLFLVNLLQQTELPECFDEELSLSQHISGWGLVELLGKALLKPLGETFLDDPLWTILEFLDGRAPGEVPAASLAEMAAYRMPAEWLKRFVSLDEAWLVTSSPNRFRLWHRSGAFAVVDCPLDPLNMAGQAAFELERYRAQGITPRLEQKRSLQRQSRSLLLPVLPRIPGWSMLPRALRQWIRWTFPFLHYLLVRSLNEEVAGPADLARLLFLKTGSIYCTATHVDLVMRMEQIDVAVRRTGLDVNPGWVRDLRRVVSFHFE